MSRFELKEEELVTEIPDVQKLKALFDDSSLKPPEQESFQKHP